MSEFIIYGSWVTRYDLDNDAEGVHSLFKVEAKNEDDAVKKWTKYMCGSVVEDKSQIDSVIACKHGDILGV